MLCAIVAPARDQREDSLWTVVRRTRARKVRKHFTTLSCLAKPKRGAFWKSLGRMCRINRSNRTREGPASRGSSACGSFSQLRTDLLAPQREVGLVKQTAKIRFGPVDISQLSMQLWLPKVVDVSAETDGLGFQEQHIYSNYRIYHATSRMLP